MPNATSTSSASKKKPITSKPSTAPTGLTANLTTAVGVAKLRLLCTMWRHYWDSEGGFKRKTWVKQKLEPVEDAFTQTDRWLVEAIALQRRNRDAMVKNSREFAYQHIISLESACTCAEKQ